MRGSKKRLSSIAGAVAFGGAGYAQGYTIDGVEYQSVSEAQAFELDPETGNALVTINGETVLVEQGDYVVVDEQILFTSEAVSVLASASGIGLLSLLILSSQDDNGNVQQGGNPPPPPVPNSPPLITSPSNPSINENLNEVFTPTLSDAEQDPLTLSIVGGADAAFFSVSNNTYFFTAAPDYENPLDADADNVYELELEVSDGNGGTGSQSVSVSVLNTNDNAPVFTSVTSIDVASGSLATGYTAIATDADGDVVTYSLSGGPDQSALLIDGTTGVLSFATAIDYANPTDNDLDNTYEVVISASGNGVSETLTVSINVQNPAANVLFSNSAPNGNYLIGRYVDLSTNTTAKFEILDNLAAGQLDLAFLEASSATSSNILLDPGAAQFAWVSYVKNQWGNEHIYSQDPSGAGDNFLAYPPNYDQQVLDGEMWTAFLRDDVGEINNYRKTGYILKFVEQQSRIEIRDPSEGDTMYVLTSALALNINTDQFGLADIDEDGFADFWWYDQSLETFSAYTLDGTVGYSNPMASFDQGLTDNMNSVLTAVQNVSDTIQSTNIFDYDDDGDLDFLVKTASSFEVYEGWL